MKIFVGILCITIGLLSIFKPSVMLRFQDIFRIQSKVEYTSFAKFGVVIAGVIFTFVGVMVIIS